MTNCSQLQSNRDHEAQERRDREKRVLLVEDDAALRSILTRYLIDHDFIVQEADSGDAAITAIEDGLQPSLLLTDIVMPGAIQGPELAQKARGIIPDLRVLFMSGYPVEVSHHAYDVAPTDRQLIKPVSQDTLLSTVFEILAQE